MGAWLRLWRKLKKNAKAEFRAPEGKEKGPPMSGWHETMDESREGGKEGELRPEMKVTPLGMLNWEDIEQALGGQTSEGVVCKPPGEDRKFIQPARAARGPEGPAR